MDLHLADGSTFFLHVDDFSITDSRAVREARFQKRSEELKRLVLGARA